MAKKKEKPMTRESVAQLGIVLGQMCHITETLLWRGTRHYMIQEGIMNAWRKQIKGILEKEVKPT